MAGALAAPGPACACACVRHVLTAAADAPHSCSHTLTPAGRAARAACQGLQHHRLVAGPAGRPAGAAEPAARRQRRLAQQQERQQARRQARSRPAHKERQACCRPGRPGRPGRKEWQERQWQERQRQRRQWQQRRRGTTKRQARSSQEGCQEGSRPEAARPAARRQEVRLPRPQPRGSPPSPHHQASQRRRWSSHTLPLGARRPAIPLPFPQLECIAELIPSPFRCSLVGCCRPPTCLFHVHVSIVLFSRPIPWPPSPLAP